MKILIVGNGGREHALLWKLKRDAPDAAFFVTRGNGGTADLATSVPIDPGELQALAGWATREGVDLAVVGPEGPLADGIADHFMDRGIAVFGPTRAAAQIEASKAYAKGLMARHGVPTAAYRTFTDADQAERYIRELPTAPVVKASGLAAGKGAIVAESTGAAVRAAREMLSEGTFGGAGREVVIEERMQGEELSVFALCDGVRAVPLLPSQDHKRIGEGDTGPNTGGMGAYAPVSVATPELMERVQREVLTPVMRALADDRRPFRGLLYAGLMLTAEGPKVVEFNCRFGDPETQAVLPLMRSSLLEPMQAIAAGDRLEGWTAEWDAGAAVTTVVASGGYPDRYPRGLAMEIDPVVEAAEDILLFHAGTSRTDGELRTSGGRVVGVTGLGTDMAEASERSRWGAERIRFAGAQFRRDIGWRELQRSAAGSATG